MPFTPHAKLDVRRLAPRDRDPLISSTLRNLPPGALLELVNDHDPKSLYNQLQAENSGTFSWDYVEQGPDVWRVLIGKRATASGDNCCCGHCG